MNTKCRKCGKHYHFDKEVIVEEVNPFNVLVAQTFLDTVVGYRRAIEISTYNVCADCARVRMP